MFLYILQDSQYDTSKPLQRISSRRGWSPHDSPFQTPRSRKLVVRQPKRIGSVVLPFCEFPYDVSMHIVGTFAVLIAGRIKYCQRHSLLRGKNKNFLDFCIITIVVHVRFSAITWYWTFFNYIHLYHMYL